MSFQCPECKQRFEEKTKVFPFCSDRCKQIDLGNWAAEKYSIPTPITPEDLEELEDLIEH